MADSIGEGFADVSKRLANARNECEKGNYDNVEKELRDLQESLVKLQIEVEAALPSEIGSKEVCCST